MGILTLPCFLLYLFFRIISATNCSLSRCGSQIIRFPFWLNERPLSCSYPGFGLTCKSPENHTVLTLPGSGDFLVRKINYLSQNLLLYDPEKCLPKRLVGFNLSGSPFMPDLSTNYTLFSCPREFAGTGTISCLSNTTRSVLAILSGTSSVGVGVVSKRCQKMDTLVVPDGNSTGFLYLLGDSHLQLKWDSPQSKQGNGRMCGFHYQTRVTCHSHPTKGGSTMEVLKIIGLSIAIPATICGVGVGVFLCLLDNSVSPSRTQPQPAAVIEGLDQATIDTYSKVVVGESKRVPAPNDDTCLICLSEFKPKETLRCIPDCHHCFHADCIDKWLGIKGTCPLCRKSPSPLHQTR